MRGLKRILRERPKQKKGVATQNHSLPHVSAVYWQTIVASNVVVLRRVSVTVQVLAWPRGETMYRQTHAATYCHESIAC